MTTPTIRQVVAIAASGANATVNLGAGTTSGDLLVIWHGNDFDTAANLPAPTTSQTVSNKTLQVTADPGTNESHLKVWTAGVTVSGAQTVSCGPTAQLEEVYNTTVVIDGSTVDLADFLDGTPQAGTSITNTASHVAPSVSPLTSDALLLCGAMAGTGAGTRSYTPPGGMTEESDVTDGTFCAESVASLVLSSSGATGAKTFTYGGSTHYATASIAVKGAAAAAPDPTGGPQQPLGGLPRQLILELAARNQAMWQGGPASAQASSGAADASGRAATAAGGVKGAAATGEAGQHTETTAVKVQPSGASTAIQRDSTATATVKKAAGTSTASGRATTASAGAKGAGNTAAATQRGTTGTATRKEAVNTGRADQRDTTADAALKGAAGTARADQRDTSRAAAFTPPQGAALASIRAATSVTGKRAAAGTGLAQTRPATGTTGKTDRTGVATAGTRPAATTAVIRRAQGPARADQRAATRAAGVVVPPFEPVLVGVDATTGATGALDGSSAGAGLDGSSTHAGQVE